MVNTQGTKPADMYFVGSGGNAAVQPPDPPGIDIKIRHNTGWAWIKETWKEQQVIVHHTNNQGETLSTTTSTEWRLVGEDVVIPVGRILYCTLSYIAYVMAPLYGLNSENYRKRFLTRDPMTIEEMQLVLPIATLTLGVSLLVPHMPMPDFKGCMDDPTEVPDFKYVLALGLIETVVMAVIAIVGIKIGVEGVNMILQACKLGANVYTNQKEKLWRADVIERLKRIEGKLDDVNLAANSFDDTTVTDKLDELLFRTRKLHFV